MEWFSGGVSAAIANCRQENALFIVFIYDDSSGSKSTDEAWNCNEVLALIGSKKYVALKIPKNSLEYRQFSQLYTVFLVPSIFCIGRTGQNLIVMNGAQTAVQLREKLNEAFHKFDAEQQSSLPSRTELPTSVASTQPTVAAQSVRSSMPSENEEASSPSSAIEESKENTSKRYKEKIKEQRLKRAKEEFERDKRNEIQRREHGKNVAKFKEERDENQNQNWLKKRLEQKEEDRLARERIKAKLEQDRLERQARQRSTGHQQLTSDVSQPTPTSSALSSVCRIQLKLPAGNTTVMEMKKTDSLALLRECVAKEVNRSVESVVLYSSYPRRELSHDMDLHTMLQLQLTPSGVIIVRIKDTYTIAAESTARVGILRILISVLHLLVYCFNLVKNTIVRIFGGRTQDSKSDISHQYQERNISYKETKGTGDGTRVRKFRQEDYHDDSEEDGTYNGNSTQQQ